MKLSDMNSQEKEVFDLLNEKLGIKTNSTRALRIAIKKNKLCLEQQETELKERLMQLKAQLITLP